MKIKVTAKELGEGFDHALWSIWEDNNASTIEVKDQVRLFKEKFHATVTGGHFDNINKSGGEIRDWNTHDAIIEFESKEYFLMFKLEWS
jgi:hypothetical protein